MDEVRRRLQPYYLILLAVLLQGLSPVLTKLLIDQDHLSATTVVAARYALAVLFLLPFGLRGAILSVRYAPPRRRDWIALLCVGGFGSAIGTLLFTKALAMAPAGVVNALSKTAPIFVAFLAYYALRERVSSLRFTLIFVMVAADVLIGLGEFRSAPTALVGLRLAGDVFALLAGLSRALAEILSKGCLYRFTPTTVALSRFAVGLVVAAVACTIEGRWGELAHLGLRGWLVLVALGGVCTSLSMALYFRGLAEAQAHVAVSLRLVGSIVTVGFAWAILGEWLHPLHLVGIAILVLTAYLIVTRAARREALAPVSPDEAPPAPAGLAEPWTPSAVRLSLKLKIAALIVAVVFATMFASSYLSLRHTESVVQGEVRVLMQQTAAGLAQLQLVGDTPRRTTVEQYLNRLVRQDIVGSAYSVRLVFIAVMDRTGHLVAFAANPQQFMLADQSGLAYQRGDLSAAQRLVVMAVSGELDRGHDLVTVRAVVERDGRDVPLVVMGYRRSLAERPMEEVRNRAVFLTLTFVLLGVAAAIHSAGVVTRSLERLARAMRRVRRGDLEVTVVPEGNDEIEDLSRAFNDMVEGLRVKQLLDHAFSAYVSRQVADRILAERPLAEAPERRTVTVLFVDLRGFTPLAGRLGPQEIFSVLNEYFERVIEIVFRHEGLLDKYAGDCIVAVWGAAGEERDDALRAVMAAVEMTRALRAMNAERLARGEPPVDTGIGVNTGEVVAGSLGALGGDLRHLEQAVVGDSVHLAQQVGARPGRTGVLLGRSTYEAVAEHVDVRELVSEPEGESPAPPVYFVLGLQGEPPLYSASELAAMGVPPEPTD